jgi:hypothetical protein
MGVSESWALTTKKTHRLRAFDKEVLRTIFALKRVEVT